MRDYYIAVLLVVGIILLMNTVLGLSYDDTDDVINKERSGLALYTDYGTGCQYLKGGLFGGTTPRMDSSGVQVCINQK